MYQDIRNALFDFHDLSTISKALPMSWCLHQQNISWPEQLVIKTKYCIYFCTNQCLCSFSSLARCEYKARQKLSFLVHRRWMENRVKLVEAVIRVTKSHLWASDNFLDTPLDHPRFEAVSKICDSSLLHLPHNNRHVSQINEIYIRYT